MHLKSNFKTDLAQEKKLIPLLDSYYRKHLKMYDFERVDTLEEQLDGIDLILTHNKTGETYFIDEKAQLDYLNKNLPTFAFELFYSKNDSLKQGWLFDAQKSSKAKVGRFLTFASDASRLASIRDFSCKILSFS